MFDSDLCYGFLLGFLTAGVFGFIIQRILLLHRKAALASKRIAIVETKQSPKEVYMGSVRARTEIALWIIILILLAIAGMWIYLNT